MRLINVYDRAQMAISVLYKLLEERTPAQSISHKGMPTREQHETFFMSRPYEAWYLIEAPVGPDTRIVGACYLTKQREIGIFIFRAFANRGYGKQAVHLLMEQHPGKFLANINPQNEHSKHLFESLGFRAIQHTYCLEAA